jgi:hypothetical protein
VIPRWDASGLSASSPGLDAIEKVVFFVKDGFKAAQPYGTPHHEDEEQMLSENVC